MTDRVLERFLLRQEIDGLALAAQSDLFDLDPIGGALRNRYLIDLYCRGLVRDGDDIVEANHFQVGLWFNEAYLRSTSTFVALTWLSPEEIWHPNIDGARRLICLGNLVPGTPLVDIVYQLVALVRYESYNTVDALVPSVCGWVRRNAHRFPLDSSPVRRRRSGLELDLEEVV